LSGWISAPVAILPTFSSVIETSRSKLEPWACIFAIISSGI
jgi:hypothetical protein